MRSGSELPAFAAQSLVRAGLANLARRTREERSERAIEILRVAGKAEGAVSG